MSTFQDEIAQQRQFQQFATKLAEAKNLSQSEAIAQAASRIEQVESQYDGLAFSECLKYAEQQAFKVSEATSA